MIKYIIKKSIKYLLQILILLLLVFIIGLNIKEDRIAVVKGISNPSVEQQQEFIEKYKTDANILSQFLAFSKQKLTGDFANSIVSKRSIKEEIADLAPMSLEVLIFSVIISIFFSAVFSLLYYLISSKKIKQTLEAATLLGNSVPLYMMIVIINFIIISNNDSFFYISGRINPEYDLNKFTGMILIDSFLAKEKYGMQALIDAIRHTIIPIILISFYQFSVTTRKAIDEINIIKSRNYIKAATARGHNPIYIMINHILPNIKYNIFKEIIISFKDYLSLIIIAEFIFCWPGIGSWLINAIINIDYTSILDGFLVIAGVVITFQNIAEFILNIVSLNQNKEL